MGLIVLPLPRRRVATQGDRARRARAAPVPGREDRALIGLPVVSERIRAAELPASVRRSARTTWARRLLTSSRSPCGVHPARRGVLRFPDAQDRGSHRTTPVIGTPTPVATHQAQTTLQSSRASRTPSQQQLVRASCARARAEAVRGRTPALRTAGSRRRAPIHRPYEKTIRVPCLLTTSMATAATPATTTCAATSSGLYE
jgi:hypothetical protein